MNQIQMCDAHEGATRRSATEEGGTRLILRGFGGRCGLLDALAGQVGERVQVARGLAPRHPPGVLLADRRGEAQLQQRVEGAVGGLQDRAEQPVDLGSGVTAASGSRPVR